MVFLFPGSFYKAGTPLVFCQTRLLSDRFISLSKKRMCYFVQLSCLTDFTNLKLCFMTNVVRGYFKAAGRSDNGQQLASRLLA